MSLDSVDYQGIECVELTNDHLRMLVTHSVGPRVLSLQIDGGENIFAELGDETLECPGSGPFHFYGGHRLWYAPENPARTYLPDDRPVEIKIMPQGVQVVQPVEETTGIEKQIRIQMSRSDATIQVEHLLRNCGSDPVPLAPWAITQLKPGGVAILPQFGGLTEGNPTLPNRSIVLWPYTDLRSRHIDWGSQFLTIRADMDEGQLKLGFPNPDGWMAYWRDGVLFIKRAEYEPQEDYYDFGSSTEVYCDPRFLEMESLGSKAYLQVGESLSHLETWEVYDGIDWTGEVEDLIALAINRTEG